MTRICSYCKKVMGYKCPNCNTELNAIAGDAEWGHCPTCNDEKPLDYGGTTHGICDKCVEKELTK